jgi:hypothetical protein
LKKAAQKLLRRWAKGCAGDNAHGPALEQYVFRLNRKVQPKHMKLLAKRKPRAFI